MIRGRTFGLTADEALGVASWLVIAAIVVDLIRNPPPTRRDRP